MGNTSVSGSNSNPNESIYCQNCYKANPTNALYCASCGKPLKSVKGTAKSSSNGCMGCLTACIIGLLLFFIFLVALGSCSNHEAPATEPSSDTAYLDSISDTSKIIQTEAVPDIIQEITIQIDDGATVGQKNALRAARSYLDSMAFSYTGLIDQLEYEGFTRSEATYGADKCGADWFEQALKSAIDYLDSSSFSYTGLIDQLEYEGFTAAEATYGATNCGADWYEQAAKTAESYLRSSAFSRQGLIDQLVYEGFTYEQAVYGVEQNGF